MPKRGRYFTAEEIVGRFTGGVTGAGPKWEERTLAGAGGYRDWILTWYPSLLRVLPRAFREEKYARVRTVGETTSAVAKRYRSQKIAALIRLAAGAPPVAPA